MSAHWPGAYNAGHRHRGKPREVPKNDSDTEDYGTPPATGLSKISIDDDALSIAGTVTTITDDSDTLSPTGTTTEVTDYSDISPDKKTPRVAIDDIGSVVRDGSGSVPDASVSTGAMDGDGNYRTMNISQSGYNDPRSSFTVYEYRVGVPAIPPLPLDTHEIDDSTLNGRVESYGAKIQEIIEGCAVDIRSIKFVHRCQPDRSPCHDDSTILVWARWDQWSMSRWLDGARKVKDFLLRKDLDLRVEFVADQLCVRKYIAVVPKDHPFVDIWNTTVREQVQERLSRTPLKNNYVVNVIRLGVHQDETLNPITILVSASYNTVPFEWVHPKWSIEALIAANYPHYGIVTLIEHGEFDLLLGGDNSNIGDDNGALESVDSGAHESIDIGFNRFFDSGPYEGVGTKTFENVDSGAFIDFGSKVLDFDDTIGTIDSEKRSKLFQLGYERWEKGLKAGRDSLDVQDLKAPFDRIFPGISVGGASLLFNDDGIPSFGLMGTIGPIMEITKTTREQTTTTGEQKTTKELVGIFATTNFHVVRATIPGYTLPRSNIETEINTVGCAKKGSILVAMDTKIKHFGPVSPPDLPGNLKWDAEDRRMLSPSAGVVAAAIHTRTVNLEDVLRPKLAKRQREVNSLREERESAINGLKDFDRTKQKLLDVAITNIAAVQKDIEILEQELKELDELATFNKHIGWIWAGSTAIYRLPGKSNRIDLALIKLNEPWARVKKSGISNSIPHPREYPDNMQKFVDVEPRQLHGYAPLELDSTNYLFKNGARTGPTVGKYSRTKPQVSLGPSAGDRAQKKVGGMIIQEKGSGNEIVVEAVIGTTLPSRSKNSVVPFCLTGDSGSAVWDSNAMVVGQVFGGTKVQQTEEENKGKKEMIGYITPFTDIVKFLETLLNEHSRENGVEYTVKVYDPEDTAWND